MSAGGRTVVVARGGVTTVAIAAGYAVVWGAIVACNRFLLSDSVVKVLCVISSVVLGAAVGAGLAALGERFVIDRVRARGTESSAAVRG